MIDAVPTSPLFLRFPNFSHLDRCTRGENPQGCLLPPENAGRSGDTAYLPGKGSPRQVVVTDEKLGKDSVQSKEELERKEGK